MGQVQGFETQLAELKAEWASLTPQARRIAWDRFTQDIDEGSQGWNRFCLIFCPRHAPPPLSEERHRAAQRFAGLFRRAIGAMPSLRVAKPLSHRVSPPSSLAAEEHTVGKSGVLAAEDHALLATLPRVDVSERERGDCAASTPQICHRLEPPGRA